MIQNDGGPAISWISLGKGVYECPNGHRVYSTHAAPDTCPACDITAEGDSDPQAYTRTQRIADEDVYLYDLAGFCDQLGNDMDKTEHIRLARSASESISNARRNLNVIRAHLNEEF